MQQQIGDLLERGARGEVVDRVAGDRQLPRLAVDAAQARRRRDHAFESAGHVVACVVAIANGPQPHSYCQY